MMRKLKLTRLTAPLPGQLKVWNPHLDKKKNKRSCVLERGTNLLRRATGNPRGGGFKLSLGGVQARPCREGVVPTTRGPPEILISTSLLGPKTEEPMLKWFCKPPFLPFPSPPWGPPAPPPGGRRPHVGAFFFFWAWGAACTFWFTAS